MTTKKKKISAMIVAIAMAAALVVSMFPSAFAAELAEPVDINFDHPSTEGVRIGSEYSMGFKLQGNDSIKVEKGTPLTSSEISAMLNGFDKDQNAFKIRYGDGVDNDGFYPFSPNGPSNPVMKQAEYDTLMDHTVNYAEKDTQRWLVFKLKDDPASQSVKPQIRVEKLKYYNQRDGKYDTVDAVITLTDWKKANTNSGEDNNSASLVRSLSFDKNTWDNEGAYNDAVDRVNNDSRYRSTWNKNGDKYTYDRADDSPYVILSVTKGGLPGVRIARLENIKYTVEFQYSEKTTDANGTVHEKGSQRTLATNVSGSDIDFHQAIEMTPGGSQNVDACVISKNTHFNKTRLIDGDHYLFKDAHIPIKQRDDVPEDAFAVYLKAHQYSMRFYSGYDANGGYSYFVQQSRHLPYFTPLKPDKTIGWTGEDNDLTHDGRNISTRTSKGINENDSPEDKYTAVLNLTREQLLDLNKANTNTENVKQSALRDAINTLFNRKITFKIRHHVEKGYNDYTRFTKYRIKDTFDPAFKILGLKDDGSIDPTDDDAPKIATDNDSARFNITASKTTTGNPHIQADAKEAALNDDDFYDSDHTMVVKAQLRKEMFDIYGGSLKLSDYINKDGRLIAVPNTAQVVIDDDGPAWTKPGDEGYDKEKHTEDSTGNQFIKSTDTTFATAVMPKPKKEALEKYVADADNRKLTGKGTTAVGDGYKEIYDLLSPGGLTENTLDNPVDEYTYYVAQTLNPGYVPYWYFKSFEISDSVANQPLTIVSAKMHRLNWSKNGEQVTYTKPTNSDASDAFKVDIADDKKSVKATANSSALNSSAFYRPGTGSDGKSNRYVLEIKVKIDKSQYNYKPQIDKWFDDAISAGESKGYTWKNTANVKITDNADPDLTQNSEEQAAASWDKNSNETKTHIFAPRFDVTKTANPYEFQVGDDIPYTIKIKNIEQNTTAGWVEGVDSDFPDGYTIKEEKATGGTQPNAKFENKKLLMEALKLPYNQELITTFKAVPDKTLNGKVVPNTAYARAWGIEQDADHTKWAAKASTSVYINSPKLDITKTPDKKPDADGKIRVVKGDSIRFTTKIKNVNPGTFMRNLYAVDVVETDGLSIKPESISVRVNSGTDSEEMVSVDKLKGNRMAYIVEPFKNGENTVPIKKGEDSDYMNGKLGSKEYNKYPIETSDKKADNEGDQLPKSSHGGFVIKFLGKYRNMGYQDKTIPATSDNVFDKVRNKVGKDVTYMPEAMRAVEAEQTEYGSSPYTKDYDNLNLQNLIEITYECEVTEDGLEEIANFIRVPATENTNNDMINNDDSIPSGGDFANTSETVVPDDPEGDPKKEVKEEVADKDTELHYTVSGENTGQPMIKTPVLEDELVTKNLVFDKDSFEVFRNEANEENKLSSDKYSIEFDDENYKFTVTVPDANLKTGEKIIVTYSGTVTKDIKTTNPKNRRVQDLTEEEVVHNKVKFCGKYAHVWTPNTEPENPNPRLTKSVKEQTTQKGGTLHYTVVGENVSGIAARQVVFSDKIKTKNFDYDKDSFRIVFTSGKTKQDTDLTEELNSKIQFENDSFKLETGKDLEKGDKITITYSGKVRGDKEAEPEDQASEGTEEIKSVDNVVVMTGSNFDALQDEETVPFGDPDIEKTARQTYTEKGKKIDYDANFTNTNDEVWRNVVLKDEITSKNAEYNKDFKIYIDGKDITSSCSFEYGEYKVTIKTGKDLAKGQKISATYSVTTTNGKWLDNKFITEDADGRNAVAFESVPPVTHEKDVKESEHDGPKGIRNTLHYTLTSKHNDDERPLKNVVITDEVLSKNLTFNNDIKVVKGDKDITGDCDITMAADKMSFEIKLKDPLNPGETIITTYSGNVKDRNQVDNETVLRADGIKGIKDDKHVPGPGDGDFMTVYKDSDPVTDSKVNAGDTITYILKAVNTGKSVIKFGHIRDYIPAGTTFESVQNGGAYNKDNNFCEWVIKDLKPGEENAQTVTFKVKVNTVNTPKEIFNHALYQKYNENPGTPGSIPNDPKLKTRYVRHYTTPTDPNPRTIIVAKKSCKPASGSTVKVGDTIKYTITLENQGNKDATSVGVRDYIPEGTKFVSAEDGGNYNSAKNCVDWMNIKIAGKSTAKVSFTVKVVDKAKKLGKVVNQALYQDEWTDPEKDPSSSTNKVVHPVQDIPMKHTKTADKKSTYKGQVVKYTLTTKILGNVKKVVITDKINSKNFKYDQKSLKVKYNGKDVTKKVKTTFKGYSFTIKTGMNAKKGDVFKVTYKGTATNGKKIINTSTAYAKGIKPIKAKHKIPPKKKPGKPIAHKKSAAEKATAKGRTIHYTLTTNIRGSVKKVVITDKVNSQNFKYNKKSLKVFFNGNKLKPKNVSWGKYSFVIKTGKNAKKGDVFKVTYSGKTTNGEKVINTSTAYAKGIKPVKSTVKIPPKKSAPPKKSSPGSNNNPSQTGDDFKLPIILGLFAIACLITIFILSRRKKI